MLKSLREWLGLVHLDRDVRDVIDRANMRIALMGCLPIMVAQLFLVYLTSTNASGSGASPDVSQLVWLCYVLVVLASCGLFACAVVYERAGKPACRIAAPSVMLYALMCTITGTILSIVDVSAENGMYLLLTFLVSSICIFTCHPVFTIPLMIVSAWSYDLLGVFYYNLQEPPITCVIMWFCVLFSCLFRFNAERLHAKAVIESRRASRYDTLTGLGNRNALRDDFGRLERGSSYVVSIMDVDDFKYFNDAFGHDTGDKVLREYSRALVSSFGTDMAYRYGGDEFLIVSDALTEQEFLAGMDRFREELGAMRMGDSALAVTSSVGYALGTVSDWKAFQGDLRKADERLFYAKRQGKNRTVGPVCALPVANVATRQGGHPIDPTIGRMHKIDDMDPLTKLANITSFLRRAQILLDDEERIAYGFYIVYMDLEGFTGFNERYGFEAGDKLLCAVADLLRAQFPNHLIARMGADRFALAVYHDVMEDNAEALHARVGELSGGVAIDMKMGICQPEPGEHLTSSVACDRAQEAANSIKGRRDTYMRIYDEELRTEIERRRYITDNFDRALSNGELEVYLQPIARTISGKACAMEALSRWNAPGYGLLPPATYIDILEEMRLIHMLDLHTVEQIASATRKRMDAGEDVLPISVNFSRRDFEVCDMPARVGEIMDRYVVPRNLLCVEITEGALSRGGSQLARAIEQFKAAGHEVWMDDFGSGYSSLNTLKDLSFDYIKIDMEFLRGLDDRPASRTIISAIVDMAKRLGIHTLIEGVETMQQMVFVRNIGCELAQGYLFSRPQPASKLEKQSAEGMFTFETAEERMYYSRIGTINPLSATPLDFGGKDDIAEESAYAVSLAIVELRDGLLWCVEMGATFGTIMKEIDLTSLVNYALDPTESPRAASLHTLVRVSKSSQSIETLDFVIRHMHYQLQARHIASMENADAFAITASRARSTLFPGATAAESTFLSDLLFTYDQVDIFDLETGEAHNLFRGNADYPYGYEGDDVRAMARKYVHDNVHPDDREGFIAFEDFSTAEARLKSSNATFLSAAFRIRSLRDGLWRWKMFMLVPVTYDGRNCLMSSARDADIASANRIACEGDGGVRR